jgi:hypothetical protein
VPALGNPRSHRSRRAHRTRRPPLEPTQESLSPDSVAHEPKNESLNSARMYYDLTIFKLHCGGVTLKI